MKIPALCATDVAVPTAIISGRRRKNGMVLMTLPISNRVIIAAKVCAIHVEVMAYAASATRCTALFALKSMELMLVSIAKILIAGRILSALGAEYPEKLMGAGVVIISVSRSFLLKKKELLMV